MKRLHRFHATAGYNREEPMFPPTVSRGLRLLIGLGLLAGACGQSTPAASPATSTPPPAPNVTSSVSASPSTPAAAATPSVAPSTRPAPPPTRVARAPSRSSPGPSTQPSPAGSPVSLPRLGTYVYNLSGMTQSPLLGIPQAYPPGATLNVNFYGSNQQAAGTEMGAKATSSQDQVQTTTKWIWEPSRVVLTFSNLTFLGLASYDCTYTPAPEILPIPLQAVTLLAQSWSDAQCSGSLTVSVQDAETVTAAGRSWNVWRIHSVLHYLAQSSVDATNDSTTLFSPELGTVVTSDATSSGKVAGSAFTTHQITTLASHP